MVKRKVRRKRGRRNMAKAISADERKWQAENDARVLADAAEISQNKSRARRAIAAAKKMARDAQKTAKIVSKQAGVRKKRKK